MKLKSELKIFYSDDGLLGRTCTELLEDIMLIQSEALHLDLHLNLHKAEVICVSHQESPLLTSAPDLMSTDPSFAHFLGAPLVILPLLILPSQPYAILCSRIMGDRLPHFQTWLLDPPWALICKSPDTIPIEIFPLLSLSSIIISDFDHQLHSITSAVIVVNLSSESTWLQASVPASLGGIGIHSVVTLAPWSAFLPSVAGCRSLVLQILPPLLHNILTVDTSDALIKDLELFLSWISAFQSFWHPSECMPGKGLRQQQFSALS